MRNKIIVFALLLFFPLLPACSTYKMDIRQGNFVTPEMRDKLKLGMSRQQVRYVMGTALVSDAFHNNRWDYVYRLKQGEKVVEQQNLTLYFDGDKLARIEDGNQLVQAVPTKIEHQ